MKPISLFAAVLASLVLTPVSAQMDDVAIEVQPIRAGIYLLSGRGGNIGLSVGADATFIVDDQFAPLTEKIVAAIAGVSDRPVDYVLNTHWHYDHTGGNENFGERGALIMAHDNVHTRMQAGQTLGSGRVVAPAPKLALPLVTFSDTLTLRINGQTIKGIHIEAAHTDGDTLVHFREANVLHMGDTYFNGMYPFIDLRSGGHIDGLINAAATALALCDDDTRIIPGHGPLATKSELQRYHDMLLAIRERVAALMAEGKSLEAIQAARPTADFDARVDADGFIKPDRLVGFIVESLGSRQGPPRPGGHPSEGGEFRSRVGYFFGGGECRSRKIESMTTYRTIAESKNFIVLDRYTRQWQVAEGLLREIALCQSNMHTAAICC